MQWMTPSEAATRLNTSERDVHERVATGLLQARGIDGRLMIDITSQAHAGWLRAVLTAGIAVALCAAIGTGVHMVHKEGARADAALAALDQKTTEADGLQAQLASTRDQMAAVRKDYRDTIGRLTKAVARATVAEAESKRTAEELATTQSDLAAVRAGHDQALESLTLARVEQEAAAVRLAGALSRAGVAQARAQSSSEQLAAARAELKATRTRLAQASAETAGMRKELATLGTASQQAAGQLDRLARQVSTLTTLLAKAPAREPVQTVGWPTTQPSSSRWLDAPEKAGMDGRSTAHTGERRVW